MSETFGDLLGRRLHAEYRPALVARALTRSDLAVTEIRSDHPTQEQSDPIPPDEAFVAALQLRDFPRHEWWEDGRKAPVTGLRAGHLTLYDLRRDPRFIMNNPFHSIHVYLPRAVIESIQRDSGVNPGAGLRLTSGVGVDDPVFRQLVMALRPAFEQPNHASQLFVDSVTLAIAAHVATTYAGGSPAPRALGGLSPRQRRRAMELIEAHLDGDLRIAEVARRCGLSQSYFAQAFKRSTGVTPHKWLAARRVDRAKRFLMRTDLPLARIAIACGFANQSHFTRVFTALVGASPGAWRRAGGDV